jgi:hypothetical protein
MTSRRFDSISFFFADLAHVQREGILRRPRGQGLAGLLLLVLVDRRVERGRVRDEFELRLFRIRSFGLGLRLRQLGDWTLSHEASIGVDVEGLEEHHRYEG